jgi:hypothetical protein
MVANVGQGRLEPVRVELAAPEVQIAELGKVGQEEKVRHHLLQNNPADY